MMREVVGPLGPLAGLKGVAAFRADASAGEARGDLGDMHDLCAAQAIAQPRASVAPVRQTFRVTTRPNDLRGPPSACSGSLSMVLRKVPTMMWMGCFRGRRVIG